MPRVRTAQQLPTASSKRRVRRTFWFHAAHSGHAESVGPLAHSQAEAANRRACGFPSPIVWHREPSHCRRQSHSHVASRQTGHDSRTRAEEMTAPAPAPWESVSPSEQLFVLITGANRYRQSFQSPFSSPTIRPPHTAIRSIASSSAPNAQLTPGADAAESASAPGSA